MIVSVTERQTYKRCRRKWDLSSFNRQSLTPATVTSGALDLGTLVHKSLADWIVTRRFSDVEAAVHNRTLTYDDARVKPSDPMPLPEIFKFHSAVRMKEIEQNYIRITGGAKPGPNEMGTLLDAMELGLAMMQNYIVHHGTAVPKHMTWVSPEQKVRIPIPNTICEVCDGTGRPSIYQLNGVILDEVPDVCPGCDGTGQHILEGTLDGLIQDKHGKLFILEHKTYGRNPKRDVLDTSDQFLAYLWILKQLNIGPIGGLAYDGMWKRAKPPRGKTLEDLFVRCVLERNDYEMAEFEQQLAQEVTEMASQPALYTNRRWEGCSDCGYERLCLAQSRGEDVEYIKRTYYTTRLKEDPIGVAIDEDDD